MHQSVAAAQPAGAPSQAPARLLIVDDDVGAITLLQRTLSDLGSIHYATTGAEALRLSHQMRPDLVMLDVHMPGLDGFAVCAALKAQQEFKHVPVVFVTRYSDAANEQRALDLGAADFVRKPVEANVLRARVRNLLALKARIDGELRALSEHWRRLADSRVADLVRTAGDGVISCDASEHVMLANAAAALLVGRPGESLVGMTLGQLLPNFLPLLELALAMPVRLSVPGPHDRARPLEIRASRSEDRLLLTLVIRDISEREQLETEQRARAVAEAAAQAKSRLLAFVNHEMGAPLNAVLGFSEVMRGDDLNPCRRPNSPGWAASSRERNKPSS
ncbi:MAG: response regulator [Roseateles sp.]|uniref:response regulator n=1 Tax=Roseateles sp. TaxID=1971397 RepID=UPI0040375028